MSLGDSLLLTSLRYCKGATKNSMFSLVIPSYKSIESGKVYKDIESLKSLSESMSDDEEDCFLMKKVYDETSNFLRWLKFQDEDKSSIGLIVYYGYIQDDKGERKKVFHTFPFEKNTIGEEMYCGERFNLSYLNRNKWFVEEFGTI